MREMWISFYMQDGSQSGTTLQVSGDIDTYTEAERMLQYIYGEDFGGIADYGFYDEEEKEDAGIKRYEMIQYARDPFDVMCGDCPVHEIEYWQEVTEDELKEEHLYQLGADASMPDFEREMLQEEGNWWPTPEKYEDWLADCIEHGYIREVA